MHPLGVASPCQKIAPRHSAVDNGRDAESRRGYPPARAPLADRRHDRKSAIAPNDHHERDRIISSLETGHSYQDLRSAAFVKVMLSTGLRFNAVRTIKLSDLNELTGEFKVVEKGRLKARPRCP